MLKATPISEMQKFHFGSKIFCIDGEDGILVQVIFDPAPRRLTHIGVKQGRLFGKNVYLPFGKVVKASGDGVVLDMKRADVAAGSSAEIEGASLDSRSRVQRADSSLKGSLQLVAVHPQTAELAYLVAHDLRPGQHLLLREEYVTDLAKNQVTVAIPDDIFKTLPPYRSDQELQQEVEAVLFDITPMHVDLKGITYRVLDGVLYLDGNVSSQLRADIVQDQAYGISGLLEIKNNLVGDDRLAADLAMKLGQDPRTRELPIGVYPRLGVVRLSGAVHNSQQKEAAEEIVRTFPGVRSVINDLVVDPRAEMLPVMAPPEAANLKDKVPGKYVRHTQ